MALGSYLTQDEVARVETKIGAVEKLTSAEIRVVLTRSSWMGIGNKAAKLFRKYGLDETAERNGVLILVDVKNKELLIYGDAGVNEKVEETFWDDIRDAMLAELAAGRLADALLIGLHRTGEALCRLFPVKENDRNEISNELRFER